MIALFDVAGGGLRALMRSRTWRATSTEPAELAEGGAWVEVEIGASGAQLATLETNRQARKRRIGGSLSAGDRRTAGRSGNVRLCADACAIARLTRGGRAPLIKAKSVPGVRGFCGAYEGDGVRFGLEAATGPMGLGALGEWILGGPRGLRLARLE